MVCPQCNAMVSKRDEVCPLCGAQLNTQTQQPQQTFSPPVQQPVQQPFPPVPKPVTSKKSKAGIVVAVIAVLAVIGVAIAISSSEKPSSQTDNDTAYDSHGSVSENKKETTENAAASGEENILAEYSSLVLPDGYIDGGTKSVEPSVGLRLRYGPSESYDIITVLPCGTNVDIIGVSGVEGWVYVYCSNLKMNGWVSEQYLTNSSFSTDKLAVSYYTDTYTVRVEPSVGLNMRNGPSQSYDVMTLLPYNKTLTVMGKSDYDKSWLYVRVTVDGNEIFGFVHSDYVY